MTAIINKEFLNSFKAVSKLANSFKENIEYYKKAEYHEAEVRKDFIDPFFTALGWDVNHQVQKNPYQQEVKVEKTQSQIDASGKKFADYAFFMKPNYKDPVFYVEAKKPAAKLERNTDYYLQTHKYAWNSNTPIAILTDFEEFIILDCRDKPHPTASISSAVKIFRYEDYLIEEKFGEIYWLFSHEAISSNSIESFLLNIAPKKKGKLRQGKLFGGGYKPVDHDFLDYIDGLRVELSRGFYANDPSLSSPQLTEVTQKTIDRLVFIRFLEDKQIEHKDHIYSIRCWSDFISLSRVLDNKYNGVVFKNSYIDNKSFKGIDDVVFTDICMDISAKESPYNFNMIPIHILGSIYERFLGKVVTISDSKVSIQIKKEVRKAGGVFYTPKFVVDYIIDHSIGKLIEGKTPKEIDKLSFVDIACGSGSFLIGVYEYLLDYHKQYYQFKLRNKTDIDKRSEDYGNVVYNEGSWILTLKRKQEVLLNSIFGVDIDNQAVEVTQLSLFLKLLENESLSSTSMQSSMFSKVLPDMTKNIICGNSLVGWDIEDILSDDNGLLEDINPMNFHSAFPVILRNGGFDAIVGNPPWVDIKGLDSTLVKYYFEHFDTTSNRMNLYAAFIHRALDLLKPNGILSYIIPSSILFQSSYFKLRRRILKNFAIVDLVKNSDNVFEGVVCETAILKIINDRKALNCKCTVFPADGCITKISEDEAILTSYEDPSRWLKSESNSFDIYSSKKTRNAIDEIEENTLSLVEICDFSLGLTPYDKYKGHTADQIQGRVFHSTNKKDSTYKELLAGSDVKPFKVTWGGKEYIKYGEWLGAPRQKRFFIGDRVLVRQIASGSPPRIFAAFASKEYYNTQTVFNLIPKHKTYNARFIAAILNSRLLNFYHTYKYLDITKKTFQKVLIQNCKKFPIPDISSAESIAKQDLIVQMVEKIEKELTKTEGLVTDKEKLFYSRKIYDLRQQVEVELVNLYGISNESLLVIQESSSF